MARLAGARGRSRRALRRSTTALRLRPSFLIVGAQKAGTTSLFRYLLEHDRVVAGRKELHFFDWHYDRGKRWYYARFPLRVPRTPRITGEGTPNYLFHPLAPGRAHALLPEVKLIAILRDPVDRAISHYFHKREKGLEPLELDEALDRESERLSAEAARMAVDAAYWGPAHQHHSYVARGRYLEQLERWLSHFRREQLHVVVSEDLEAAPAETMDAVFEFLGLPPGRSRSYPRHHEREYPAVPAATRSRLAHEFVEPNQKLYAFLGRDLRWTEP